MHEKSEAQRHVIEWATAGVEKIIAERDAFKAALQSIAVHNHAHVLKDGTKILWAAKCPACNARETAEKAIGFSLPLTLERELALAKEALRIAQETSLEYAGRMNARVTELVQAIRKYGQHDFWKCDRAKIMVTCDDVIVDERLPCTCGFSEVFAALPETPK